MKFSLNENVSGSVIRRLREAGHDVLAAKESMQGESDTEILIRAQTEGRIVVVVSVKMRTFVFRV
ncbi:DUF5615 family PIN-like protein [Bythopirellula goksoeyrii]|uniref:DUF5615 domain-containing protein n=1 Tax=Bythopirellula goksoeyrii TaxID=1400387 RepID=A0A5B9Q112_9BACT|nr:hypothetical protein Pr1d_00060 [Bythopirellula goksoeyrii]